MRPYNAASASRAVASTSVPQFSLAMKSSHLFSTNMESGISYGDGPTPPLVTLTCVGHNAYFSYPHAQTFEFFTGSIYVDLQRFLEDAKVPDKYWPRTDVYSTAPTDVVQAYCGLIGGSYAESPMRRIFTARLVLDYPVQDAYPGGKKRLFFVIYDNPGLAPTAPWSQFFNVFYSAPMTLRYAIKG